MPGPGLITPLGFAALAASTPQARLGQTMGTAELGRELGDAGGPLLVAAVATLAALGYGCATLAPAWSSPPSSTVATNAGPELGYERRSGVVDGRGLPGLLEQVLAEVLDSHRRKDAGQQQGDDGGDRQRPAAWRRRQQHTVTGVGTANRACSCATRTSVAATSRRSPTARAASSSAHRSTAVATARAVGRSSGLTAAARSAARFHQA